jgi:hypothetical protein
MSAVFSILRRMFAMRLMFCCHSVARRQQTRLGDFAIKALLMTCTAGRGATARFAKRKLWGKQKPGSTDLEPGFFMPIFSAFICVDFRLIG